jgi:hypothetical protein
MDEFTHVYTDAVTGEVIIRPLTEDEIAEVMARREAAMAPVVPTSITPRQCRLVLMSQGLLPAVEQAIADMDEATRITWEYALEFRRDDPLLNALGKNMNLTDEQIDQFFIAAARL